MTLIIGMKCSDGIVMGADSAATLAEMGQEIIRQETVKLEMLENRIIVGVSGPVGLGQRIKAELQYLWTNQGLMNRKYADVMKIVRENIWNKHILPEMQIAQMAANVLGPVARTSALTSTLVAWPLNEGPQLIQFDATGAPEMATESNPYVAIGSGEMIALPFLEFLKRVCWQGSALSLNEGVFTTVWALQHAILTNAGGVAGPIQIVVLENVAKSPKEKPVWKPRQLKPEELDEHLVAVDEHEKSLGDYHRLKNEDVEVQEDIRPPKPA